jgi:hypothetical protein
MALGPREVRALVTGIAQWVELRTSVAYLLLQRPRRGLVQPLWRAWQRFPEVPEIAAVLADLALRFGWDEAVDSAFAPLASTWVTAPHPGISIQQWLARQRLGYSDLPDLAGSPFLAETPLLRLVRDAVLTHGSEDQLRKEAASLLLWSKELTPRKRVQFGQNYLTKVRPREWSPPLLGWIATTFGLPRNPRLPAFWEPVAEDVRAAFQRYFIRKRMKEAFRDDTDRYEYWLTWEDTLIDFENFSVGGTQTAALRFPKFGVIEFFEVGHAAYIYTLPQLAAVLKRDARRPDDLKDKHNPPFAPYDDNRIVHQAYWAPRANLKIRTWLGHAS